MRLVIPLLSLLAAGCVSIGSLHKPDAFGAGKTYAVVTVMAGKTDPYSAAEVLESTYPTALKVLRTSRNLRIAGDAKANRAYQAASGDPQPTGMMRQSHTVAKGYKYFSDESLPKLAREMKVDGVIVLTLSYHAARSGAQAGGANGSHKAQTTVVVRAVDKDGKNVWFDQAAGESDHGVSAGTEALAFPKLRALFVESTENAAKKLMENFSKQTQKL